MEKTRLSLFAILIAIGTSAHAATNKKSPVPVIDRPVVEIEADSMNIRSMSLLENIRFVSCPFASSEIDTAAYFKSFLNYPVAEIWMIYSDYSQSKTFNQKELNRQRIENLYKKMPWLKNYPDVKWQDMVFKKIKNADEAKNRFHGFVIVYKLPKAEPTLGSVLDRHRDWDSIIVVADVTTSMLPWLQEVNNWLGRNLSDKRIDRFVYFNDGGGRPTSTKRIGQTGGVYSDTSHDYLKYTYGLRKYLVLGLGNTEIEENTLEALLEAQKHAGPGSIIVLLADNFSTPRDTSLIDLLRYPIKVIACGAASSDLNPSLVNIAYRTGGSIHTGIKDIMDFKKTTASAPPKKKLELKERRYQPDGRQMLCLDCKTIFPK
jgi:hypothetical protein